jgi:hypothetical protein
MAPYRESLSRLLTGRELEGAPFYLITYASLAGFYAVAMHSGSIWVPLQFVGATAGGLGWLAAARVAFQGLPSRGCLPPRCAVGWIGLGWAGP